jgi:hypothetical protein
MKRDEIRIHEVLATHYTIVTVTIVLVVVRVKDWGERLECE